MPNIKVQLGNLILVTLFIISSTIVIRPQFTNLEVEAQTISPQGSFQFPKLGAEKPSNGKKYLLYDNDSQELSINNSPVIIYTQTFKKVKQGFAFTTASDTDFNQLSFQIIDNDGNTSPIYALEKLDAEFGDQKVESDIISSNLYTFSEGIDTLTIFSQDPNIAISIETYDFSLINPYGGSGRIGTKTTEVLTDSIEGTYLKKLFKGMGLTIVPRHEWGAPTDSTWEPTIAATDRIVVHHTVTDVDLEDPASSVKAIYDFHAVGRGWGDIGYNFLIDPYGTIYKGRSGDIGAVGAAQIPNTGAISISLLGNFEVEEPTQAAMESLTKLISGLSVLSDIDVQTRLFGHRDINITACPGANLYNQLETVADLADQLTVANTKLQTIDQQATDLVTNKDYVTFGDTTQLLVNPSQTTVALRKKLKSLSRGIDNVITQDDLVSYIVDSDLADRLIKETMLAAPDVIIQPNYIYQLDSWDNSDPNRAIPSDYDTDTHFNQEIINVPEAWKDLGGCASNDLCGGEQDIIVAVLDTGVAYEDYNFDAGSGYSYPSTKFSGIHVEVPGNTTTGTYNEGYDRQYFKSPELANVNFVGGYDSGFELMCNLRASDGNSSNDCNATELAKINHANDDEGHGTFVSTIIAGDTSDNAPNQVVGIAHNVSIMPVKVMLPNDTSICQNSSGNQDLSCSYANGDFRSVGTSSTVTNGINYAVDNGAHVINMSLGGYGIDPVMEAAVDDATAAGVVVVVSAGNENDDIGSYFPASFDNAIAVGATNPNDSRSSYSNYGTELDISAPVAFAVASRTLSCFASSSCSNESTLDFSGFSSGTTPITAGGTSFSAPQVSALVALMLSQDNSLTVSQVRTTLFENARDVGAAGWDSQTGWGVIDVEATLNAVNQPPSITISEPDGTSDTADALYSSITWTYTDNDGDPVSIDFYADTDNSGLDGYLINNCSDIDTGFSPDTCAANTGFLPDGDYYVYGCITDNKSPEVCSYSPGQFSITHSGLREYNKTVADHNWKKYFFSSDFEAPPVLFAQITSEEGAQKVFLHTRNVTKDSFEVKLKENTNYNDGNHSPEEISFYATESTSSEEQINWVELDHNWQQIDFINSFLTIPVVYAYKQTETGNNVAYVDIQNVTTTGFEARIEEPDGYNGTHPFETVGWIAFEDNSDSLETGYISTDESWKQVDFSSSYSYPPVLIAQINSEIGISDKATVDIRNLTTDGFEFRIEEELQTPHSQEEITWTIFDYSPKNKDAGKQPINHNWKQVRFNKPFPTTPIVISEINSENGADTVEVDLRRVNKLGFQIRLEEDPKADWNGFHGLEEISWLAIGTTTGNEQIGTSNVNQDWQTINFPSSFATIPKLFAQAQTENGGNTGEIDIRNVTTSSFDIRFEEDMGVGWDGLHTNETIGWYAFLTPELGQSGFVSVKDDLDWETSADQIITFDTPFSTPPKLIAEIISEKAGSTAQLDIRDVTTTGFTIRVEEEPHYYNGFHTRETIAWNAW